LKKGYTHIGLIVDESGSMDSHKAETIKAVNDFIEEQKLVKGKATLTLVKFNSNIKFIDEFSDLNSAEGLTTSNYKPSASTALRDALGATVDSIGSKLASMPEKDRPEKVLVITFTDGEENSSRNYSVEKLKGMIEHQQDKYSWTFLFVGANQDSFLTAQEFSIPKGNALNFSGESGSYVGALRSVNHFTVSYRESGPVKVEDAFENIKNNGSYTTGQTSGADNQ
jgi:hypothetical protein